MGLQDLWAPRLGRPRTASTFGSWHPLSAYRKAPARTSRWAIEPAKGRDLGPSRHPFRVVRDPGQEKGVRSAPWAAFVAAGGPDA